MNSIMAGLLVAACIFAGGLAGLYLNRLLPRRHLTKETQGVIRLCIGMLSVLASLVLGLLIASAKSSFDAQRTGFQQSAANFVLLDRTLAQYGPEAKPARDLLRRTVATLIDRLWPADGTGSHGLTRGSHPTGQDPATHARVGVQRATFTGWYNSRWKYSVNSPSVSSRILMRSRGLRPGGAA